MKALVKKERGPGNIEVMEVPEPSVGEGEVLIEISAAGICHTDFLLIDWGPTVEKVYDPPLPVVMGHEFSGRVKSVGNGVEGFETGDPVVVNPIITCGRCTYCLSGTQQVCTDRTLLGFQNNGGFAEYVSVPSKNVYKLPESIDLHIAALCEPFNTIIRAFQSARPNPGDTVLISGPGPIGILGLLMARFCGCGKIIMSGMGLDEERLKVAEKLGAVPINIEKENIKECIQDLTQGVGVDIAVDTSGNSSAISEDLNLLGRRGKMILVGLSEKPAFFVPVDFAYNETTMIGIRASNPRTWETCINILSSGKIDLSPVITHRIPLADVESGFERVHRREGLKILVDPKM